MVRFHQPIVLLGLCCCLWQQPVSAHDREGSVFLTSGQGDSVKRISVVDSTDTPCWMPDGRSILYVAHTSSENSFHRVSTSGGETTDCSGPFAHRHRGGNLHRPRRYGDALVGQNRRSGRDVRHLPNEGRGKVRTVCHSCRSQYHCPYPRLKNKQSLRAIASGVFPRQASIRRDRRSRKGLQLRIVRSSAHHLSISFETGFRINP